PVLAVTVYWLPLPLTPVIVAPVTAPVVTRAKSEASTPVTLSLNSTVHDMLAAFVGVVPARLIDCTVGAVVSTVLKATLLSVLVDARLALPAASVAAPAGTLTTTVPVPAIPDTATLYVEPVPVTVAVSVPPRVLPAKLMSPAVNPVTVSLNVTVKLIGLALVGSVWPAAWLIVTVGAAVSALPAALNVATCISHVAEPSGALAL